MADSIMELTQTYSDAKLYSVYGWTGADKHLYRLTDTAVKTLSASEEPVVAYSVSVWVVEPCWSTLYLTSRSPLALSPR